MAKLFKFTKRNSFMKPLIVMPTYNEKENILELIPKILELEEEFSILIVDDNSPDGTGSIADEFRKKYPNRIFTLHREKKQGLGKAYLAGFDWALNHDFDPILEMDADGSHDPQFLSEFLKQAKEYDLIIGSRYYNGRISVINWDLKRVFLSIFGSLYARIITGVNISDATAGFKCFRRHALKAINLKNIISEGYSFQIEMNWRIKNAGFKIKEIPIIFYERNHGKSKMSGNIIKEALWVLWKMRIKK